jgi:hypothetical protein
MSVPVVDGKGASDFGRFLAAGIARMCAVARHLVWIVLLAASAQASAALQLKTSVNPTFAKPGEWIDIEITVSNTDLVARTGVAVSIVYPAGLNAISPSNFGASCPPSFCDPGETITWSLGTLQPGRSITVDLPTVVAAATADGTIINFNFVATDSTLQVANSTSTIQVETTPVYDVALRDSADPTLPGSLLTYKLTFGYREEALGVSVSTLRFPVPAGTTFVSATGGGSLVGGTVEWNIGQMLPGEGGAREVTVQVNAPDNSVLQASAQIFNTLSPGEQAGAEALTVVETTPLITIDVDANPDPARPSEQLNVQLVVTNRDAITRTNLSLRVRYPDGVNSISTALLSSLTCPPSFCDPGEQATFTIPTLAAGQTLTLELPSQVAATTPDGTAINFFAMLSDATGGNATGIDSVRVRTLPNYDISIRDSADPVQTAAQLTYKLTYGYRNEAPSLANATMRFRLPAGTSFLSASDGGSFSGGFVTWDLGVLTPGDGNVREVVVQVNAADAAVLQASAEIFDALVPIEQAGAEALTVVDATPKISVDIDANPDPARPNELLNLLAVVTNHDAVPRTLTLRLRYPDGLASILLSETFGASCSPSFCDPFDIVTYSLGSIAAGASTIVELPAIVSPSTSLAVDGQLINFYATLNDTVGGNASGFDTVRIRSDARYDLAVRESADPVQPGDLLTYKLSYGYRQEAPTLADSTLRFRLAPGTSFVSATGGGTLNGSDVSWNLGTLAPGDGGFREVTVQVNAGDASVLQGAAEVFDNANPTEQAAWETLTTVDTTTPIEVQIDVNADPARPGEMLNAQLIVTNHDVVARTLTLRGRYPEGTQAVAASNAAWNTPAGCSPSFCDPTNLVTWSFGSVAAGQSVTVELPPLVAGAAVAGQLINFFAIVTDTVGGSASSSDNVRVSADTRYDLMIRDSADAVLPGAQLTYKLTFGYRADAPVIADSTMRFRLPAGTSFLSASGGGFLVGDTVVWDLGSLSPGDGGIRAVNVEVDAPDGSVLQAQGEVFSTFAPVEQAQAEALTTVDADPKLSLDVDATTNPSQPNQPTTVTLTVTNLDAIARTVTLRVRFPDGVNTVSPAVFVPAGSCPPSFCDAGFEMVTWNLGSIPASGFVVVTMPMTVAAATVNGQLINFFGVATDTAGGIATGIDTVRLGVCVDDDADCDSVLDTADNCIFADNSTQRDTDLDGIGNQCDADLDQNCNVNFVDLGQFKSRFFGTDPTADFNGDGQVNFVDLGIMKEQFFLAPGPSGVPNACD